MTCNITDVLEKLVADVVHRVPEFRHIDPAQLLICVTGSRSGGIHGTYAKIHPLRFEGGGRTKETRRGRRRYLVEMPELVHNGQPLLYLIYFLVPRFLDLPQREKLVTIFHELYHISPRFDGDIRRFPGRNYAHGSSRKKYNDTVAALVDEYLDDSERPPLPELLSETSSELRARHRRLVARRMKPPRLTVRELPKT